jgi:CheY-like chemotaxis protein
MESNEKTNNLPDQETVQLRKQFKEAEEFLDAMLTGQIDTIVAYGIGGEKIYSLEGAGQAYRFMIQSREQGAIVISADRIILYCSESFAAMFNAPVKSFIGKPLVDLVEENNREKLGQLFDQALLQEKLSVKLHFVANGGDIFPVFITMQGLTVDNVKAVGMAVRSPSKALSQESMAQREMASKIRILLVDDHAVMRQGLSMLLSGYADLEVAGEAADGEEAVRMAMDLKPDVILMDISMPRMNGIEATRIIRSEFPRIGIIGLSMFDAADQAEAIKKAGADYYLKKSGNKDELLNTIRLAAGVEK